MNPFHIAIQLRRKLLEFIPTYCVQCGKKISYLETDDVGTFTLMCWCGCSVYKQHAPDEHNETYYYTKNFINKSKFRKDFKNKDPAEKLGFKKIETKEGLKYVK